MKFDLQILELVCSRLCHDLISPVGAIGNGLELMEEDADDELMADARRLVQSSTHRASSLLQMYRCAYGNAGNQPSFGAAEAVKLAKDAIEASRIELKAAVPPAGLSWPGGFGKVLVNGILTTVEWLPRGGSLTLTANLGGEGADADFTITAEGQQAACSEESARLLRLDRQGIDLTAHNIQPYLTGLIAAHHSYRLEISQPVAGAAILTGRRSA